MSMFRLTIFGLILMTCSVVLAQSSELFFSMQELQAMRVARALVITLSFSGGAQMVELDSVQQRGYCGYLEGLDDMGELQAGWDYSFRHNDLFVDFELTTTGTAAGRFGLSFMDFSEDERMHIDYYHAADHHSNSVLPTIHDEGAFATLHFAGELTEGNAVTITVRCEGLRALNESELEEYQELLEEVRDDNSQTI